MSLYASVLDSPRSELRDDVLGEGLDVLFGGQQRVVHTKMKCVTPALM